MQRENETLKKSSAPANQDKVAALEQEAEKLKVVDHHVLRVIYILLDTFLSVLLLQRMLNIVFVFQADFDKLKSQSEAELSSKLESKTKGLEKIVMENERLRKEIKRVTAYMFS